MADFDDMPLRESPDPSSGTPHAAPPPKPSPYRRRWMPWAITVAAMAVVVLLLWLFWPAQPGPEAPPGPVVEAPEPTPESPPVTTPEVEPLELPPLAASDVFVRELVEGLAEHPQLARLLAGEELVRRFVATVDNVARGTSPRPHLRNLAPEGSFTVRETSAAEPIVIDPANFRRYDPLASAFTAVDAADAAELYRQLEPLMDDAYRQLGYPDADFDVTLRQAIAQLLEVPVLEGPIEVRPGDGNTWAYADPRLEGLTPPQKTLLRTGPDNVRRIQGQLRAIRDELSRGTG